MRGVKRLRFKHTGQAGRSAGVQIALQEQVNLREGSSWLALDEVHPQFCSSPAGVGVRRTFPFQGSETEMVLLGIQDPSVEYTFHTTFLC